MTSEASRDRGLRRISRSTRYLAVGALLAGGALSAVVAKALPGRSGHATTSTQEPQSPAQSGATGSNPSGNSSGTGSANAGSSIGGDASPSNGNQSANSPTLSGPQQAPQPAYNPPVVSSGGS